MGDASPIELVKLKNFTQPEVLFVPYAYALTPSAVKQTLDVGAKVNVLLHLPQKESDEHGLWDSVLSNICDNNSFVILNVGEEIEI